MASSATLAHIEAQRRLRETVRAAVTRIWAELPDYHRPTLQAWLRRVLPAIEAGQRASVALTEAYIAQQQGRRPQGLEAAELIGAGARNGAADPGEVYSRPFTEVWTALAAGAPLAVAAAAGLARAQSAAVTDIQLSMRATSSAVQTTSPVQIYGWQRVADGGACDFCLELDGAFSRTADVMPIHPNCGCGIEPIMSPTRRAPTPTPASVRVNGHGELGPTLGKPGQHFTGPADVAGTGANVGATPFTGAEDSFAAAEARWADPEWSQAFADFEDSLAGMQFDRQVGVYASKFEPSYSITAPGANGLAQIRALPSMADQEAVSGFIYDAAGPDAEFTLFGIGDPDVFYAAAKSIGVEGGSFHTVGNSFSTWVDSPELAESLLRLANERGLRVAVRHGRVDW